MNRIHKMLVAAITSAVLVSVCVADTEEEIPNGQISDGVELPVWQEEYAVGHFDTSLWPEAIVQKIEVDHLRFLVSIPETSPEDREIFLEIVHNWEKSHDASGQALSFNMPVPST